MTSIIILKINIQWYENTLIKLAKLKQGEVELRKEIECEEEIKQKYIVVHSIKFKVMKVDFQLRKMSAEEKLHIKYVLFKYNNSNERMSGLKLNQLTNTELRYE